MPTTIMCEECSKIIKKGMIIFECSSCGARMCYKCGKAMNGVCELCFPLLHKYKYLVD